MNPAIFDKPFFEVTLPLMLTILAGVWAMISTNNRSQDAANKRLDDMMKGTNSRLDEIVRRLERIEDKLDKHDSRIAVLEERTSLLRH